jgi:hypothetical protein
MSRGRKHLVLAIQPLPRGFAFALFEGPLSPLDWGMRDVRGKHVNSRTVERSKEIIRQCEPDVLVLEECGGPHSRRGRRASRLLRLIAHDATSQGIEVHSFARAAIRECFQGVGAVTRYEIAQAIAAQVTAFGHKLPPLRKAWMSEDVRMGLFDAASLIMTYYCRSELAHSDR